MKKLLCIWILALIFNACDEDIDPNDIVDTCSITSITSVGTNSTTQTTYEYDSEKRIKRINFTDRYITIEYNDNLISRIESFSLSNISQGYNLYEYNEESKLIRLIFFPPNGVSSSYTYQYNVNGQIISSIREGQTQPYYTLEYDSNQNLSKLTRYSVTPTSYTAISILEYQYDENKSPFVSLPEYGFSTSTNSTTIVSSTNLFKNNAIKVLSKNGEGIIQGETLNTDVITNQYKFPTSLKRTSTNFINNTVTVTNLSYAYNCE